MPVARDHKRIGENDTGPNTGGMGSITDESLIDPKTLDRVIREISRRRLSVPRNLVHRSHADAGWTARPGVQRPLR